MNTNTFKSAPSLNNKNDEQHHTYLSVCMVALLVL